MVEQMRKRIYEIIEKETEDKVSEIIKDEIIKLSSEEI